MPDSDGFFRFATDQAAGLARLACAVTGDTATAERLVEDALVETFRTWPGTARLSPLLVARRAVVARRPRQRATLHRPDRSLQLQDVTRASVPSRRADPAELDRLLWEAIGELGQRDRLVLALRFGAGLPLAETAQVLRLPILVADRLQRRAVSKLCRTADLDALPPESNETGTGARFEASVRSVFTPQIGALHLDVDRLVERVRARTSGMPKRPARSPLVVASTAGAVVAAVAAAALLAQRDHSANVAEQPPAPPGTQLVGYRNLAVAVPANWKLYESPCGRMAAPAPVRGDASDTQCAAAPVVPSVTFTHDLFEPLSPLIPLPQATGRAAGKTVLTTEVTHAHGVFRQTALVPRARFVMTVRSPDRRLVAAIIGSVRAVPAGYAVVPVCESLPVRDAVAALKAVGLTSSIAHASLLSNRYGEPPVTFQDQPSGSVVPDGTAVALTIPSF